MRRRWRGAGREAGRRPAPLRGVLGLGDAAHRAAPGPRPAHVSCAPRRQRGPELDALFAELEDEAAARFAEEGAQPSELHHVRSVDMRYAGQEHAVRVPVRRGSDRPRGRRDRLPRRAPAQVHVLSRRHADRARHVPPRHAPARDEAGARSVAGRRCLAEPKDGGRRLRRRRNPRHTGARARRPSERVCSRRASRDRGGDDDRARASGPGRRDRPLRQPRHRGRREPVLKEVEVPDTRSPVGLVLGSHMAPEDIVPDVTTGRASRVRRALVLGGLFFTGAMSSVTAALGATRELPVGIGIVSAVTRHPALLAMELAAMSRLYPGRVRPGVGLGVPLWLDQMGLPRARRSRRCANASRPCGGCLPARR